jgi:hypothetical protein
MTDTPEVIAARIEVARRRGEMLGTVHELQARLQPKTLASEAWAKARNKGADMAEDAVDAVKARPVAIGGVAAALGLFLARRPISDAAVKLYDALTSDGDTKANREALKPRR